MSASLICSQCGTALPAGTPAWLCPKCLLGHATASEPAEEPTSPGVAAAAAALGGPLGGALPCRLGAYELVERIGQGGMGVVYKARQISLERYVAVKVLSLNALVSPEVVHRFRTEAVTAGSLQHPNIVAVHEVGLAEGQHYLVMDYVPGPTLADMARNGPLPAQRAAQYLRKIAEAVHFAHERGILHRDLKPSNVLIDANDQPRVTDFGLAKRFGSDSSLGSDQSSLTLSGQVLGSPAFIPPEQASGQRGRIGRRSDVYSLGAILYQLLTGRPPFVGEALADTLRQVLNEEPLGPRLLKPAVPRELETICLKCLEKEPHRRYPTAQTLAEELRRFLEGKPIMAQPVGRTAKVWRWCRRNPRLALATGVALLSLLIGFVGVAWQWRRAEAEALLNRRNAYAADMNLVQRALEDNDRGHARELLNRYRPVGKESRKQTAEIDLRGWEWRYLWARCQSDERFTLWRYSNAVSALAFSSDGKWLAVRREGGAVALWDAVAKRSATNLPGTGLPNALAFSPRINLLAWGNLDANGVPVVSLWDLSAEREIARFPHSHAILSIAFSPDAKQMAALAFDGTVRVWDLELKQFLADFPTARDNSYPGRYSVLTNATAIKSYTSNASENYGRVLFSPDGRWLVVGEAKPRIRLLDRTTSEETIIPLPRPADGVTALAFSPDSQMLAAGCGYSDYNVHVWDLANLAAITNVTLAGHGALITGLAFSPDGQALASVSNDRTLRLWDVARKAERRPFQGNTDAIRAIAWSPDGQDLVTGATDGSVRYWGLAAQPRPPYAILPPIWFWGPAFLPDGKTFLAVTRTEGAVIRLEARWDVATVPEVERLTLLGTNHTGLDLSRDGRWLAVGDSNANIQIWDFPLRQQITNLVIPNSMVFALIFSAGGHFLNCGAFPSPSEGRLTSKIWEVATWREIRLQNLDFNEVQDVYFSPDERTMAIGFTNGTAAWYDLKTGRRRTFFECNYASAVRVEFSPDKSRFATASMENGLMTVWDVATQRPKPFPRGPDGCLYDLAFSPDGRRLVASGHISKDVVRLWDVETGREVLTLSCKPGAFSHIGFSLDDNTLFAASPDGTALLWCAPSWEEIVAIEKKQSAR